MKTNNIESCREKHTKYFWMDKFVIFLSFFLLIFLFSANYFLLGSLVLIFTSYYIIHSTNSHNARLKVMNELDPCHAVWVGDSYFFKSMTVTDGYGERSDIYKDDKGLFVFRYGNLVGISSETTEHKEYLKPHVQKAYTNFLNN